MERLRLAATKSALNTTDFVVNLYLKQRMAKSED